MLLCSYGSYFCTDRGLRGFPALAAFPGRPAAVPASLRMAKSGSFMTGLDLAYMGSGMMASTSVPSASSTSTTSVPSIPSAPSTAASVPSAP
eukprot:CAMPEP_0173310350 /NCGR_PEP_ID=MMETSP1143-20121109/22857_1 /TAXON_ID=483371 /ORGANISM="non described non described, Strain CCMP2298" /LENGTH=91 /DNA_ID=CAMNT_0014252083 /DNA_START=48 /DNA_END=319 /DNA_ORIENTATION=+